MSSSTRTQSGGLFGQCAVAARALICDLVDPKFVSVPNHPRPMGFCAVEMTGSRAMFMQGLRRFRRTFPISAPAHHGHHIGFMCAFFVARFRDSLIARHQIQLRCGQYALCRRAALLATDGRGAIADRTELPERSAGFAVVVIEWHGSPGQRVPGAVLPAAPGCNG